MEKVREEQISVEVFGRLERSQILVGKDCRILTNEAKREFASELVVPFRANDVIVEDVGAGREIAETREEVSVIDSEFTSGADGKKDLRVGSIEQGQAGQRQEGQGARGSAEHRSWCRCPSQSRRSTETCLKKADWKKKPE